ncbi:hypothetical protein BSKO_06201 [Bryopsis sp. KO-2023]|nr:hypothetical protein BSKO_06201 [Bryopsis sp. KO-2023]
MTLSVGRMGWPVARRPTSIATSGPALLRPDINIVHVKRPLKFSTGKLAEDVCSRAIHEGELVRLSENISTTDPTGSALDLVDRVVQNEDLRNIVAKDICQVSREFELWLGLPYVRAKLEISDHAACTQFHTDHVKLRFICTYMGPGTVFLDHRFVGRSSILGIGEPDKEKVCQQAEAGDLLYLKGHDFPGDAQGFAAIHRSPLQGFNGPRLMLVVDDVTES